MKTNKSFMKRLKVTRNGKLVSRKPGQNHFNAKQSRPKHMQHQRSQNLKFPAKVMQRFINTASASRN